jgi:predicted RNase H-like nuclease (RuvC/YqgF family)
VEELHIENKSLKDIIDKVSKRLQSFEISTGVEPALQESMRLMRPNSPASLPVGVGAPNVSSVASFGQEQRRALMAKVKTLEDSVNARDREVERVARENEKLKGIIESYCDKWEKLREG